MSSTSSYNFITFFFTKRKELYWLWVGKYEEKLDAACNFATPTSKPSKVCPAYEHLVEVNIVITEEKKSYFLFTTFWHLFLALFFDTFFGTCFCTDFWHLFLVHFLAPLFVLFGTFFWHFFLAPLFSISFWQHFLTLLFDMPFWYSLIVVRLFRYCFLAPICYLICRIFRSRKKPSLLS